MGASGEELVIRAHSKVELACFIRATISYLKRSQKAIFQKNDFRKQKFHLFTMKGERVHKMRSFHSRASKILKKTNFSYFSKQISFLSVCGTITTSKWRSTHPAIQSLNSVPSWGAYTQSVCMLQLFSVEQNGVQQPNTSSIIVHCLVTETYYIYLTRNTSSKIL